MNTQPTQNNQFRGLHLDELERYAARWVEKFPSVPVRRVLLYHFSTSFPNEYDQMQAEKGIHPDQRGKYPAKYAIVFELAYETKSALTMYEDGTNCLDWKAANVLFDKIVQGMESEEKGLGEEESYRITRLQYDESFYGWISLMTNEQIQNLLVDPSEPLCSSNQPNPLLMLIALSNDKIKTDYDRLNNAIRLFDSSKGYGRYPELLDSGFIDVYEHPPENDQSDKAWRFFVLNKNGELPLGIMTGEQPEELYNIDRRIRRSPKRNITKHREKFSRLNLTTLSEYAEAWCNKYYFLDAVTLHHSRNNRSSEFVLSFIVNELFDRWEPSLKVKFLNWKEPSLLTPKESLLWELCKAYSKEERTAEGICDEWFIPIIKPWEDSIYSPDIVLAERTGVENNLSEKVALNDEFFLPNEKMLSQSQSTAWKNDIARWAKSNRFITGAELICLLAYDESYAPLLPGIWKDFQMDIDGYDCPDPSSFDSRVDIWAGLFQRWTHHEILGVNSRNRHELGIETKIREDRELKYEIRDNGIRINLDELERHLSELVRIPHPTSLFPDSKNGAATGRSDSPPGVLGKEPTVSIPEAENGLKEKDAILRCDPNTTWEEITITLMSCEKVQIKTPVKTGLYTYHSLDMQNKKQGDKPKKIWYLLVVFCYHTGRIDADSKLSPEIAKNLLSLTKQLNAHLKQVFGIKDSIFKYHYKKKYAYITKINFQYKLERNLELNSKAGIDEKQFDEEVAQARLNSNLHNEHF